MTSIETVRCIIPILLITICSACNKFYNRGTQLKTDKVYVSQTPTNSMLILFGPKPYLIIGFLGRYLVWLSTQMTMFGLCTDQKQYQIVKLVPLRTRQHQNAAFQLLQ